jgi:chromosome segregation ATPase
MNPYKFIVLTASFLMANNQLITPELITAIVSGLVTGGLALAGIIVTSRKDRINNSNNNQSDLAKSYNSTTIDLLELNNKEIKDLREDLKQSQTKYEQLFKEFQEQKIQINNLVKKCEDLQAKNEELQRKNQELINRIDAMEHRN